MYPVKRGGANFAAYTRAVRVGLTLIMFVAFLGGLVLPERVEAQGEVSGSRKNEHIASGVVLASVATSADARQGYALYLPSGYTAEKKWPIVYAFDPFARGETAVELFRDGAEQYGYIVAGSNNSRNGSWKDEAKAAEAMFRDTQERFSVDERLIYFGGLSGGARVAAQIAALCKCAAGVFLNGAGFDSGTAATDGQAFAVFATTGTEDFNYPEVVQMDEKLAAAYPHWLRIYDGPHQWAPKEVASEALEWFRVVATGRNFVPRDEEFLKAAAKREEERAEALARGTDLFAAWREYRQAASTFGGLHVGAAFEARAAELGANKAVREGMKREKRDFEEQERLSGAISSGLAQLGQAPPGSRETMDEVREEIRSLRERTAREKQAGKHRVYVRALTGIFVQAMEAGNGRQTAKDYGLAGDYYELAAEAEPESGWALRSLAAARAQTGDRKAAFAALRKAKQAAKDQAAFAQWLEEEPAFEKLRRTTEFGELSGAATSQH